MIFSNTFFMFVKTAIDLIKFQLKINPIIIFIEFSNYSLIYNTCINIF